MSAARVVRREPPYEIHLTRERRFIFDYDTERQLYRVAWYEKRRLACKRCQGSGFPKGKPGLCKECHGRRFEWKMQRTTGVAKSLDDAISAARNEREGMTLDTALLADYVFSTEWGAALPGARPWPGLDASLLASAADTREYLRELDERERVA